MRVQSRFPLLLACCLSPFLVSAQTSGPGKTYTTADYMQAEKFMAYNTNPLVFHEVTDPTWMPDGRFWYRDLGPKGISFIAVDPAKGTKGPAFDQAKLAVALAPMNPTHQTFDPYHLPIYSFELSDNGQTVILGQPGQRLRCDLSGAGVCTPMDQATPKTTSARRPGRRRSPDADAGDPDIAPDRKKGVFIRNWNLWMRDLTTQEETQLTFDGVPNYGYATDNAGWTHSDNPIVVWSPDSSKIATFQQDQRKTGEVYLTNVTSGHSTLTTLKYPLVGDKDVTMIERVVIDLPEKDGGKAKIVRLKMPPDQHRSTLCDDISCKGGAGWDDVEWSKDGKTLAFVSTSRDHKQEWMRLANPDTGEVHDVMGETVKTFFESGNDKVNWHYLSTSNELLWFSERDGWGHLYLYDARTGKLKNQITSGSWNVTQVLGVDEGTRTLYFIGVGREAGNDPYYQMYYRVQFDGSGMQLLTPERENHNIYPSADNKYFVDAHSTPIKPQETVVRDAMGKVATAVTHEDISRLQAAGWQPPVQIQVKGRDGQTDVYGFLFRPTNFSTDGHYPIVDHVYPGPQGGWGGLSCGDRNFHAAHGDMQSLSELGFIVVCLDGMGGAYRSKAFHETYFANLGDDTIPDQVTGIKQLAERYPWIDVNRVGMFGHSGGGNATASAMFHFPDFFKVGIAESGNHDARQYEDDWAEKWAGLEVKNADGTSNYDEQSNEKYAANLKGKLLLAHGTMDDNVPLNNTLLVVDALIKANKDFDLVLFPNEHHGYGSGAQYMTRRRWDYFVTNLAGGTPPKNYQMRDYASAMRAMSGGPADVDFTTIIPDRGDDLLLR